MITQYARIVGEASNNNRYEAGFEWRIIDESESVRQTNNASTVELRPYIRKKQNTSVPAFNRRQQTSYFKVSGFSSEFNLSTAFDFDYASTGAYYPLQERDNSDVFWTENGYPTTVQFVVPHDEFGNATINVEMYIAGESGTAFASGTANASIRLPQIQRPSEISDVTAAIGKTATFNIIYKSISYSHKLFYVQEGVEYPIAEVPAGVSQITWNVPESFYSDLGDDSTYTLPLKLVTYSGTAPIGEAYTKATLTLYCAKFPEISAVSCVDSNTITKDITKDENKLIKVKSTPLITFTAKATQGTNLKSYSIIGKNSGINLKYDFESESEATVIKNIGIALDSAYTIRVEDKRGKVGEYELDLSNYLIPYFAPNIKTADTSREKPLEGAFKLTISGGSYYKGSLSSINDDNTADVNVFNGVVVEVYNLSGVFIGKTTIGISAFEVNTETGSFSTTKGYELNSDLLGGNGVELSANETYELRIYPLDRIVTETDYKGNFYLGLIVTKSIPLVQWKEDAVKFNVEVRNKDGKSVVDLIYPIGAIYISTYSVNPNYIFGGTWERISGKFLLGADDDRDDWNAGKTGGEETHTLTVDEMPVHTHKQNAHSHGISTWYDGSSGSAQTVEGWGTKKHEKYHNTANATATNQNTGGGQAHNNMPPFLAVYMWERIA